MIVPCTLTVNGTVHEIAIEPGARLIDVLRERLDLTGTKEGCGNGECGACTVIIDGLAVNACLFPALEAEGKSVTTIEGLLGPGGAMSPVQDAFAQQGGVQCGFCSPGMIMSATALLEANPDPSADEIRDALVGNLCRCTGYIQIIESIQAAAAEMRRAREADHG